MLPADFDEYRRYSRRFKAAVADMAPQIEDRGIDEIYIDLTHVLGKTVELAQRIKDHVRRATGLSCSIGVTPNKLLSKIASELQKPGGLTVLSHADLPARIWRYRRGPSTGSVRGPARSSKPSASAPWARGHQPNDADRDIRQPPGTLASGCRTRPR